MKKDPISAAGLKQALKELDQRRDQFRPRIRDAIKAAREEGDLKENAEYHAAREEQSLNEARITSLETQINRAEVIEEADKREGVASVGSEVTFKDTSKDKIHTIILAHPLEAATRAECLSVDSPVGKAIRNKALGTKVNVTTPKGVTSLEILEIN